MVLQSVEVVDHENAPALARFARLNDENRMDAPRHFLVFRDVLLHLCHLSWDDPGLWEKAEVDRVLILHLFQTRSKLILLRHSAHRRKVVYTLMGLDLGKLLSFNPNVLPYDINVSMSIYFFLLQHVLLRLILLLRLLRVTLCGAVEQRLVKLLRCYHLPAHHLRSLSEHLVLGPSQVDSYTCVA